MLDVGCRPCDVQIAARHADPGPLRAEMKLPGLAWLGWQSAKPDGMTTYSQRAIFQPRAGSRPRTGGPYPRSRHCVRRDAPRVTTAAERAVV
jgi:hypothetical protein